MLAFYHQLRCCGIPEIHPECQPIYEGDRCWEYTRTSPATTTDCALGKLRVLKVFETRFLRTNDVQSALVIYSTSLKILLFKYYFAKNITQKYVDMVEVRMYANYV